MKNHLFNKRKIGVLFLVFFLVLGFSYTFARFKGGTIYDPKAVSENQKKIASLQEFNNLKQEINNLTKMSLEILNIPQHFKDVQDIVYKNLNDRFNEGIFSEDNTRDKLQEKTSSVEPYFTEGGLHELYAKITQMRNETIIASANKTNDLQELEAQIQRKTIDVTIAETKSKLAEHQKNNLLEGMDARSKDNALSLKTIELKLKLAKSIQAIEKSKISSFSDNNIMFSDPSEEKEQEKREKRLQENGVDPYKLPSFK